MKNTIGRSHNQEWLRAASERYHVTWSNVSTVKFDTARIKAESPELYADYAKPSSYRRFEVKAA